MRDVTEYYANSVHLEVNFCSAVASVCVVYAADVAVLFIFGCALCLAI